MSEQINELRKFKLPRAFAEKWVKALRSGEYTQVKEQLTDNFNSFCCLGVACVLEYKPSFLKTINFLDAGIIKKESKQLKVDLKKIPEELKGSSFHNHLVGVLTGLNDDDDKSFLEIADWIEKNVAFYD